MPARESGQKGSRARVSGQGSARGAVLSCVEPSDEKIHREEADPSFLQGVVLLVIPRRREGEGGGGWGVGSAEQGRRLTSEPQEKLPWSRRRALNLVLPPRVRTVRTVTLVLSLVLAGGLPISYLSEGREGWRLVGCGTGEWLWGAGPCVEETGAQEGNRCGCRGSDAVVALRCCLRPVPQLPRGGFVEASWRRLSDQGACRWGEGGLTCASCAISSAFLR